MGELFVTELELQKIVFHYRTGKIKKLKTPRLDENFVCLIIKINLI
jgi:hypothetical protein